MKKDNIKSLIKAVCFFLIVLLLFGPYVLSGELFSVPLVRTIQSVSGDGFRYGAAYIDNAPLYKLANAKAVKAEVLALGSSRVLQFNDFFFKKDAFYNAGGSVSYFDYAEHFLSLMEKDELPRILIIGLDEYFFNPAFSGESYHDTDVWFALENKKTFSSIFDEINADVAEGKIKSQLELLLYPSRIGVMAKVHNQGFEKDGSYYYGELYASPKPDAERVASVVNDIMGGANRYPYATQVDSVTMKQLESLLSFCRDKDIHVIAFTPPISPSAYDAFTDMQAIHRYYFEAPEEIKALAQRYGAEYYNYGDTKTLFGMDDSYYIDGFHGSDTVYLRLVIDMVEKGSELGGYCDEKSLLDMYENRIDNLRVVE